MLITLTGAHSTGKTTLLEALRSEFGDKFEYVSGITRSMVAKGLAINEKGDNITQLLILNTHFDNLFKTKDAILDRCLLDVYIYTKYLHIEGKVDKWVVEYAYKLLHDIAIHKYKIIFYTDPDDVPLVDDGVRSVNHKFRNDIINLYNDFFTFHHFNHITKLKGSVAERVENVKYHMKHIAMF